MIEQTIPEYTTEDVQTIPELIDGVITNMEVTTAFEIFKDKADKPENKILRIKIENDKYELTVYENCSYFEKANVPDNSKLGKIIDYYKELKVGMRVKLLKNSKGYFNLRI